MVWGTSVNLLALVLKSINFFNNHVSSASYMIPGLHFNNIEFEPCIIWTNAGLLLIGPLETNLSEILIEIYTFSFKKRHFKSHLENGGHFISASRC